MSQRQANCQSGAAACAGLTWKAGAGKDNVLPDHLHTRVGESRTSATGTDCYMCVLKGGNYSLYEYMSVIYAAEGCAAAAACEEQSYRP